MTTQGETREVTAQVTKVVAAKDKEDLLQWETHVRWPWTPKNNEFDDRTWVYREQVPNWDADTSGAFNLLVEASYTKKKKDESRWDGSSDWMWYWTIVREINHTPAPAQSSAPFKNIEQIAATPNLDQRIAWNSAVNNAVHLLGSDELAIDDEWLLEKEITRIAKLIYSIIIAGPPVTMPQGGHQIDVQPPEQRKPAQRPGGSDEEPPWDVQEEMEHRIIDPVEALRQSIRTWNKAATFDNHDSVIGTEEILAGLDVLFGIKTKNAADGVALLTPDQLLEMQGLIARGEYCGKIAGELTF